MEPLDLLTQAIAECGCRLACAYGLGYLDGHHDTPCSPETLLHEYGFSPESIQAYDLGHARSQVQLSQTTSEYLSEILEVVTTITTRTRTVNNERR